jgi:K(+)-stimulated pyrophosphate-energized sodium pump
MQHTTDIATFVGIGGGILALLWAVWLVMRIMKLPTGTARMGEIADAIREGAVSFMKRQYGTIAIVAVIITIVFVVVGFLTQDVVWQFVALSFALGAAMSAAAGIIGMSVAVRANVRTTEAARKGLASGLNVAFQGGAVSGLAVVGLALLGVAGLFWVFTAFFGLELGAALHGIVGFAFGASLVSLFARVGGGIYTKAADVGADLVGKVEAGIPEDDPRNPAVIADNVGDNVGDCAGMGADLFETYAVTAIAAMLLGYLLFRDALTPDGTLPFVVYPLLLGGIVVVATLIGTLFVRLPKSGNIMGALYRGVFVTAIVSLIAIFFATQWLFSDIIAGGTFTFLNLYLPVVVGMAVMAGMIVITEYYTATRFSPVRRIARASETGAATNIISGLAVGLQSTLVPTLLIAGGILASFLFAGGLQDATLGLYGIGLAAVSMLSTTGMIVALDSYGPITDNAGGIAEMADLEPEVRKTTDALDAVGNTTKATTKGYAIGSAALAALALFADYVFASEEVLGARLVFELSNPVVLVGLFIGAMLPFIFSSLLMEAVGKAAFSVIAEVRRQFKEIKGIMTGKAKPEYGACVDIVTRAALREMILPGLLAVFVPLIVGFTLGPLALGGLLIGVIISGLLVAISMANGGGAWDNAKKLIEDGQHGGKGSEAHKAAVVGDTVGDPYKDTAGPAINALIKVINTVSLIFAGLIVLYHLVPGTI